MLIFKGLLQKVVGFSANSRLPEDFRKKLNMLTKGVGSFVY